MFNRFYWILLITGLLKTTQGKTQWTLTLDPSIKNAYSTLGRINTGAARTMTHCAVECHVTQGCVAIGYSETTTACHLYQTDLAHLQTSDFFDTTDAIDYYRVSCYGDYMYLKQFDVCLKQHSNRQTWQDASNTCEADGTRLLVVKTRELLDFLKELIVYTQQHYWLGASAVTHGDWYWQTGEQLNASTRGQLWLPGRSTDAGCLETEYARLSDEFGVHSRNCSYERQFFCEKA